MGASGWKLPVAHSHALAARAGTFVFVGGAGDFDAEGVIRHPNDFSSQVAGAMDNLNAALSIEGCTLDDIVRLKVYYQSEATPNEWEVLAAIQNYIVADPKPAITAIPTPLQPFDGQQLQIQAIAIRGWRLRDFRHVVREVPKAHRHLFKEPVLSAGLRAGEFISIPARTAAEEDDTVTAPDVVAQTRLIMERLEASLNGVGASLQDAVKMEGYYFGTSMDQWEPLARARAGYFREPGPVATTVPCHALYPAGALTKVEVMAMRESWNGFDKYIPRHDSWPRRVWDWPIPLPYRQGLRLRDTVWLGGQVPFASESNSGKVVLPGDLPKQTQFTMSYIDDILNGFDRSTADLALLVCYYKSSGEQRETEAFLKVISECIAGPLPPITLVPQPHMHSPEGTVEIWGVARVPTGSQTAPC